MIHQAHERQLAEEAYARSVKQAEQLVEAKKYDEAEAQYLKLMEQRPEDTQLYVELAQMYVDQQRYVDAKALIKRAIKITGDKEAFKQLKKDIKILTSNKWKKAYIEVLEDNESEIRRYEDRVQASCAICDVNGDMKPELFFFTGEYYGYGKLHIYTTVDNKAKEVEYECENQRTQYDDAFYDVAPNDSSYAIFNSSEVGKFSIYANIVRSGDSRDTTNEYNLNLNGGCRRVNLLEGTIDTTYSEGENDDSEYQLNGEEITYNKYIGEFKRVLDEAKQVILYSGSDDSGGDQAVWGKINPDTVLLRATWMYDMPKYGVVNRGNFLINMLRQSEISFSFAQHRAVTYVREVAGLIRQSALLPGGAYNYGSENDLTMFETAEWIRQTLSLPVNMRDSGPRHNLWMDCSKIRNRGIHFSDTVEGLQKCIRDYSL